MKKLEGEKKDTILDKLNGSKDKVKRAAGLVIQYL